MYRLLASIARYLSVSYKIALFMWLLYCLAYQFKHRREIIQYSRIGLTDRKRIR
jgi:hypothetical protein